jgi:hypothetical protein
MNNDVQEEFLSTVYKHKNQGLTYLSAISQTCVDLDIELTNVLEFLDQSLLTNLTIECKNNNLVRGFSEFNGLVKIA